MKKLLLSVITVIMCVCMAFGFAACPGGGDDGKSKWNTFEAEYVNLEGLHAEGESGDKVGVELVYGSGEDDIAKGWSKGFYIGPTCEPGFCLKFIIQSDKDATGARLDIRVGSETAGLSLSPSNFQIKVNETTLTYSALSLTAKSGMSTMTFEDKTVSTSVNLKKGENVITLTVLENTIRGGKTAGPMIDCIKVQTTAKLTWTIIDNPAARGLA